MIFWAVEVARLSFSWIDAPSAFGLKPSRRNSNKRIHKFGLSRSLPLLQDGPRFGLLHPTSKSSNPDSPIICDSWNPCACDELLLPEQRSEPNRDIWKPDSSSGFSLEHNRESNPHKSVTEKLSGLALVLAQKRRECLFEHSVGWNCLNLCVGLWGSCVSHNSSCLCLTNERKACCTELSGLGRWRVLRIFNHRFWEAFWKAFCSSKLNDFLVFSTFEDFLMNFE